MLPRRRGFNEVNQELLDRLFAYRAFHLGAILRQPFNVGHLPYELQEVAYCLGICVVNDPELQEELLGRLAPIGCDQVAEQSATLEAITVQATLALSGQGKPQVFVREIAAEVDLIRLGLGETGSTSPEKVGHCLKKLGLRRQRLGQKGNGLMFDRSTLAELEKLKDIYFPGGLARPDATPVST